MSARVKIEQREVDERLSAMPTTMDGLDDVAEQRGVALYGL